MSKKKHFALSAHIAVGTHHFGNMQTLVAEIASSKLHRGTTIEIIDRGIIFKHEGSKRKIFVPFANVKSIALPWDSELGDDSAPDDTLVIPDGHAQAIQAEIAKRNGTKGTK